MELKKLIKPIKEQFPEGLQRQRIEGIFLNYHGEIPIPSRFNHGELELATKVGDAYGDADPHVDTSLAGSSFEFVHTFHAEENLEMLKQLRARPISVILLLFMQGTEGRGG